MSAFWWEIPDFKYPSGRIISHSELRCYHADFMLIDAKETIRYLVKNEPQTLSNKEAIRGLEKEIVCFKNRMDYLMLPNALRMQAVRYIRNGYQH